MGKSESVLKKISVRNTSTPTDNFKSIRKNFKFCSPIDQNMADRKGINLFYHYF